MSDGFAIWLLKTLMICFVGLALWDRVERWLAKRDRRDGVE